jgi:hypothetical protein
VWVRRAAGQRRGRGGGRLGIATAAGTRPALARIGIDVVGKPDPLVVILSGDRPCPDQDPHRYDVVVAPDLVDGFADPQVEFARMFRLVAADGVVICSAHLYDGGDLSVRPYVFGRGHASYYTRDALDRIASAHELQVDVRIPEAGNSPPSRKRYVIFSRSAVVMASVEAHFRQAVPPPTSRATPRRASALAADRGSTRPNALA